MVLTAISAIYQLEILVYYSTIGIITGLLISCNAGFPLLTDRVGPRYIEAGSVCIFVLVSFSQFVFQNFDGLILNEYSRKSSLQIMVVSASAVFLGVVFLFSAWLFQRKHEFAGYSGDDEDIEEDGYTQERVEDQDEEGQTGLVKI